MINNNIIRFKSFTKFKNLLHGFSTREFGSMRPDDPSAENSLGHFLQKLQINPRNATGMKQVHSNNVRWVTHKKRGQRLSDTDGILSSVSNTYLIVLSADCIPVLIYDNVKKITGAVHAGWRGVYNEILKMTIDKMVVAGSDTKNIFAGIGPCIRACCYGVSNERADLFRNKFSQYQNISQFINGANYLNLPQIAFAQLLAAGIQEKNIEDCGICTSDNNERLFSYRKEGKNFGEFIGIIGRK